MTKLMTKHSVTHRPDCDLEGQSAFLLSHVGKFKWCPRCGVPYSQVVVDPATVRLESLAYPTIIRFSDTETGTAYRYHLRGGVAKIEDSTTDKVVWSAADHSHDGDISVQEWSLYLQTATDFKFVCGPLAPTTHDDVCQFCAGKGTNEVITNPLYHYEPGEDPEIQEECCDECGGTGRKITGN